MVNITIEIDELKVLEKAAEITLKRLNHDQVTGHMLSPVQREILEYRLSEINSRIAKVFSKMDTKELCDIDD